MAAGAKPPSYGETVLLFVISSPKHSGRTWQPLAIALFIICNPGILGRGGVPGGAGQVFPGGGGYGEKCR